MNLLKIWITVVIFSIIAIGNTYAGNDIELKAIKDVTYQDFKDNTLTLTAIVTVNNPNWLKVKIKKADLKLCLNDAPIGHVTQIDPIVLKGKTEKDYPIQIAVKMESLTSGLPALFRMLMNDTKRLNFSGSVIVRSFFLKKTYQIDNLSFQ